MAVERVFSLGEDNSSMDEAGLRNPHLPAPCNSWWSGRSPLQRGSRARAGCSSRQQDTVATGQAATALPCGEGPVQHPPNTCSAPRHHTFALLCGTVGELGFRHSPVSHGRCERGDVLRARRSPAAALWGLLLFMALSYGRPLSLNPRNYLCSCTLLGEPMGLGWHLMPWGDDSDNGEAEDGQTCWSVCLPFPVCTLLAPPG